MKLFIKCVGGTFMDDICLFHSNSSMLELKIKRLGNGAPDSCIISYVSIFDSATGESDCVTIEIEKDILVENLKKAKSTVVTAISAKYSDGIELICDSGIIKEIKLSCNESRYYIKGIEISCDKLIDDLSCD